MAPAARRPARTRRPLTITSTPVSDEQTQIQPNLIEIFDLSQHVTSTDAALTQLKKLYKNTEYRQFEEPFKNCVKKLLQSKQSIYFKTSCDFLCKFLQHLSKLSDEIKVKERGNVTTENAVPGTRRGAKQGASKKGTKRKSLDVSDDELAADLLSTTTTTASSTDEDPVSHGSTFKRRKSTAHQVSVSPITNHDRIISSCIDVADHYMQLVNEECRFNAVYFVCKFLTHVESLDEEICEALKSTLPKRIRDRKPMIRAQAVLASRTFQDNKMTQDAFSHHFYRDPELVVRKALLQIMDTKIFGYNFLVDSTQDSHELMRKAAFQRLGRIQPTGLNSEQLHRILHNGLNERERQPSYVFRSQTLDPWLNSLYDGIDLHKLLNSFNCLDHHEDVRGLLELIFERDLDKYENNGTTTRLHQIVESFRSRWLSSSNNCLPNLEVLDEKVIVIWLTLVKFCKKNQAMIKPVKILPLYQNESIEKILDSQERTDEVAELYERLTPDLVNLVDFLKDFVQHSHGKLKNNDTLKDQLEFIYKHMMDFMLSYEIGDEMERKTVQEVLGCIIRENLLTGKFENFIPPIIKCLFKLVYSSSSTLMINYISELIHNVRSHLEDMITSTQPQINSRLSTIAAPLSNNPRSVKKVRIDRKARVSTYLPEEDQQNLEYKIATMRVDLEELKDKLDVFVKEKDFDQAKTTNDKIIDLKKKLDLMHERRCSIASDVTHMSMIIETDSCEDGKLSSTMIGDESMSETQTNVQKVVFKHHTYELIKCLQMYFSCLQNVKITEVPQTMLNHLEHLSYECLDDWFKEETRVRSLMIACNGLTALINKNFADEMKTKTLLITATCYESSIDIKTIGFKSLVDVVCTHNDLEYPMKKVEDFLRSTLRIYGKYNPSEMKKSEYDFLTAIVEGTTKLFYFKKISSPAILSHLILWWYHPRTESRLKQFIGVFLPTFVNDLSRKQISNDDTWLRDLLEDTFVTCVEYLHNYILGEGFNIMAASDMYSLINFLCNLIPISFHPNILIKVEERIESISDSRSDLLKYLKQCKNSLSSSIPSNMIASDEQLVLMQTIID